MNITNLKEMNSFEVRDWIFENIPELTSYQKEIIGNFYNSPILNSDIYFFKRKEKKSSNFFLRLTIIPALILYVMFIVLMPVNFLFTGRWGYDKKIMGWFIDWCSRIGLNV